MSLPVSFKNVGKRVDQLEAEKLLNKTFRQNPIGFKTPFQFGGKDEGIFAMHFSAGNQIQDNFRNLLLTNHGERVGIYDFGCNLQPLTTELTAIEEFEQEAMLRIKKATSKFMPFVNLQDFSTSIDNLNNKNVGKIKIAITYNVPILGIQNKKIEVILFVI